MPPDGPVRKPGIPERRSRPRNRAQDLKAAGFARPLRKPVRKGRDPRAEIPTAQ
jgi:hypothetical protein